MKISQSLIEKISFALSRELITVIETCVALFYSYRCERSHMGVMCHRTLTLSLYMSHSNSNNEFDFRLELRLQRPIRVRKHFVAPIFSIQCIDIIQSIKIICTSLKLVAASFFRVPSTSSMSSAFFFYSHSLVSYFYRSIVI